MAILFPCSLETLQLSFGKPSSRFSYRCSSAGSTGILRAQGSVCDAFYHLHSVRNRLSEIGTHSNTISLGKSFKDLSTPQRISWGSAYFETDPQKIATFLFTMLVIAGHMEETFFRCYETRLNLDYELVNMRTKFEAMKEQQRAFLRTKYKIGAEAVRYR